MKKLDRDIIKKVADKFKIGNTEKNSFIYVGLNIKTTAAGITLNQTQYTNELEAAKLRAGPNNRPLEREETKLLQRMVGQLNWVAIQSRPDMSNTVVDE